MSNGKSAVDEVVDLLKTHSFSDDEIMKKAEKVGEAIKRNGTEKTKLREYFGQVKALAMALKTKTKTIEQAKIELYKMKARIAYDTQRQKGKTSKLKKLIDAALDNALENDADLKKRLLEFSDFFECVMGYYTYEDIKK